MTRQSGRTMLFGVAMTLLAGAAAVGCDKSDKTSGAGTSNVTIALTLPDGTTINTATYQIFPSGSTTPVKAGSINVSDAAATPSVAVSLTAGTFTVSMDAKTSATPPVDCTGTSAPFTVVAGTPTNVSVTLTCGGSASANNMSTVMINGTIVIGDNCPNLTSWMASPLTSSTAGKIDVSAVATDADASETLTYLWTSSAGGTFVNPNVATTQFNCSVAGAHTLTVTATDNHTPTSCATSQTMVVNCVSLSCGNGALDTGEQCDASAANDPNKNNCDANCHLICGNGVVGAGEQCDPPRAGFCSATCQNVAPLCGDGFVQAGEDCEPPNTATCDATCHNLVFDVNATCQTCEKTNAQCDQTLVNVPGASAFGCQGFAAGPLRTSCLNLIACIRTNHCANGGDDATPCLCGAVDPATCATSGQTPTGVCLAQYQAALAAGLSTGAAPAGASLFTLFVNPKSPLGIADNLLTCDADAPCVCGQ